MAQNEIIDNKTIVGRIDKVIFLDSKSGRTILSVIREDGKICRVIGNVNGIEKDSAISANGTWKKDEKYGWQFIADSIEQISQVVGMQEPVEDGLVHALDFSNVLNTKFKAFRNFEQEYFEDDYEDYEGLDNIEEYIEPTPVYSKKQSLKPQEKEIKKVVVDGATYDEDMKMLFSIPNCLTFSIPHSVEFIADDAFSKCENLTYISVGEGNDAFICVDGVLFNKEKTKLISCSSTKNGIYEIPDTVINIGDYAFRGCSGLTKIEIPNSISFIGKYSFSGCTGLKSVKLSESLISVGEYAFQNCTNLEKVEIGIIGINIDDTAFEGCGKNPLGSDIEIDWGDILFRDGSLLVMEGDSTSNIAGRESLGYQVTDNGKRTFIAKICHKEAKRYMGNIVKRLNTSLPKIIIRFQLGSKPYVVNEENLNEAIAVILENRIVTTEDIDWKYVEIVNQAFSILNNSGKIQQMIPHNKARGFMNNILLRVSDNLPKLKALFVEGSDMSIENKDILDGVIEVLLANRITKTEEVDWQDVSIENGYFSISYMSGTNSLVIRNHSAKSFMNNIAKRVSDRLPKLKVHIEEGLESKLEDKHILDDVIAILRENIIVKNVEVDWHEVKFLDYGLLLTDPSGHIASVRYEKAMSFMNKMLKRMADYLPRLIVHFEEGKEPIIENLDVLDDITTILTKRQDYGALIRSNIKTSDVLEALNVISKNDTRVFVPRDMTPFLDFLSEHQAIDTYPIVPVEEYIGGSYEEGALFTIILNGMPYIVWENFKDSRSTYVFKCTESNYEEKRQRIYDYIVTEESNKRQFLRNKECKQIFGEKPHMIVHNNLKSWSEKLMNVADSVENEDELSSNAEIQHELPEIIMSQELPDNDNDDLYDDDDYDVVLLTQNEFNLIRNIKVYVSFLVDFESYFADDELWDEEGTSRDLYENGRKAMYAETAFTIKDAEFCEDDFTVYAGTKGSFFAVDNRDVYNPVDLPKIEIVSRSRFNGVDGIVERICDIIESYDFDFAPYGSEVRVKIYNKGKKYTYDFSV